MRKKSMLIAIMMSVMISTPLFVSSAVNFISTQEISLLGGSGTVDIAQGRSTLSLTLSNAELAEVTLVNSQNQVVYENLVKVPSYPITIRNLTVDTYTLYVRFEGEVTRNYLIKL